MVLWPASCACFQLLLDALWCVVCPALFTLNPDVDALFDTLWMDAVVPLYLAALAAVVLGNAARTLPRPSALVLLDAQPSPRPP